MKSAPHDIAPSATRTIHGFDVSARAWVVDPDAHLDHVRLPALSGQLFVDARAARGCADARGGPVAATLLPGRVEDIVRMMRFCDEQGILFSGSGAPVGDRHDPVVHVHAAALGRRRPRLRVVHADQVARPDSARSSLP